MNLNKVLLIGRLAADPETRTTPSGAQVCSLRIATNRVWTDKQGQRQEETEFHSVTAWGRTADIAGRYLQKGALAYIEGRLRTRSWEDASGIKKFRTEIIAESLQLGPRGAGGFSQQGRDQGTPPAAENRNASKQEEEIPVIEENEDINIEDIPF